MWRFGMDTVAGDKFNLGSSLDTGTFLLGHTTWEKFSKIWPGQSDEFSTKLNAMPKLVVSRSHKETDAWNNSALLEGELVTEVTRLRAERDIVVTGSLSVVRTLAEHDLIDEYRLIAFPTIIGAGQRLFTDATKPTDLRLVSRRTGRRRGPHALPAMSSPGEAGLPLRATRLVTEGEHDVGHFRDDGAGHRGQQRIW